MPECVIIFLVSLIAFAGGWWTVLIGAIGLSISTWHDLWLRPRAPSLDTLELDSR
jgi:hypothetical protein